MQQLTATIKVKDASGRVVEEKEVATYAGVLARAHEDGLTSITTELVQVPHPDNGMVAIVTAKVVTAKGTFTGIGDANPDNVGRKIVPHLIRMAETRAKVRALRDAVNIGMVSFEELGNVNEGDAVDATPAPAPAPEPRRGDVRPFPGPRNAPPFPAPRPQPVEARRPAPEPARPREPESRGPAARPIPMTDNQRRLLYRMLSDRGFEGQQATDALLHAAEVNDLRQITKDDASMLIAATDTTFRRVLVLRRGRAADGEFVERLRDALMAHHPARILASGFQPDRDAHLAAALRRLAIRDDTPVVHIPNVRLLARQLRHRMLREDDGEAPEAPVPPVGPTTPPPPVAVGVAIESPRREVRPPLRLPYVRPAFAPA